MAALTLADYRNLVDHALHGGAPNAVYTDADTTRDQIINDAGRHMVGLHPWPFRKRPPINLTVTSAQKWMDLPVDFGEVVSLIAADGMNVDVYMSSAHEVESYRSINTPSTGSYYVAYLSWPTQNSPTESMAGPRLEIEPVGTSGDEFVLVYLAGWRELTQSGDVPNIPLKLESLFSQYVQAFARYQDDNQFDAIFTIDEGPMVRARMNEYSRAQWQFGTIDNGAMQNIFSPSNRFDSSDSPSDPS